MPDFPLKLIRKTPACTKNERLSSRDPLFEKRNTRLLFAAGKKSGDTLTKEGAPAGNEIGEAVRPVNYLLIGTGGSSLSQSLPFVLPALSAAELPSPPTGPGKAAFWSLVALRPRRSLEQGLRGRSKTLGDDLPPAKGLELSSHDLLPPADLVYWRDR